MNNKQKIYTIALIILTLFFAGCLEDLVPPPLTGELDGTAKILMYFEEQGDYINSDLMPLLVTAEELHNNLNTYHIVDVRNNTDFSQGHIENAVNILHDSLYTYMENISGSGYDKIVIVSKNGQGSSYYSALLKLSGFDNVFSLKYGMASWHEDFADEWLAVLGDKSPEFVDEQFEKNEFTDFPVLSVDNTEVSIEEIIKERIKSLLLAGFNLIDVYVDNIPGSSDSYLVCYGSSSLYFAGKLFGYKGHPVGTTYYRDTPMFDFRSINYLQTLPADRKIVIYCYDGQLSSSVVAYLKILGYKARSLLFGANQLSHPRMLASEALHLYAFTEAEIKNFEYVTGE